MTRRIWSSSLFVALVLGGCAPNFGFEPFWRNSESDAAVEADGPSSPRAAPRDSVDENELEPLEPARPSDG